MMPHRLQPRVIILLTATVLVTAVFLSTSITEKNAGFDADGVRYAAMSGEESLAPRLAHIAPWCYRLLTPYLASLLPFDTLTNFRVLAFVSNILSLILLLEILALLETPVASRFTGVLLYAGSFWTLKFSFYSPAYIDYQTQMLLLLIVYLTLRQRYALLPFVFAVAVMQRESLAAFSVFSVAHMLRHDTRQSVWGRTILAISIVVVPFLTLFVVRSLVVAENSYSPTIMVSFFLQALNPEFWPVMLQAVFSGLGIIPIILLTDVKPSVRFIKRHWEWALYGLISIVLLFGGADKARLFLYLLPLAVILAVQNVTAFRGRVSAPCFVLWSAVVIGVQFYLGGYLSPIGTYNEYLAKMVPVHSGGRYLPYLLRNMSLALAVFAFTKICVSTGGLWPNKSIGRV